MPSEKLVTHFNNQISFVTIVYNFEITGTIAAEMLLQNRAFQYGDGLFETMIYRNGKVYFLSDHLLRLTEGMLAFSIQPPADLTLAYLEKEIPALVHQNGLQKDARVKLQICRKAGGLYTPTSQEADFYLSVYPLHGFSTSPGVKEKVLFFRDVRLCASTISRYKTCSALPYVMAGLAKKEAGADDMVLLDAFGHIAECTVSNLFWIKESKLYTPSLDSGCIAGIMRKQILLKAARLGIVVVEGLFTVQDLLAAEAVFCSNVAGIQLIRQIEEISFSTDKLPQALFAVYG